MQEFQFNPCNYITLRFECPKCRKNTQTERLYLPSPDYSAERNSDSEVGEEYWHSCNHCGEEYEIDVQNGMCGGYGTISPVNKQIGDVEYVDVDEGWEGDDEMIENEILSAEVYAIHISETVNAVNAIDNIEEKERATIYRTLYANLISCMEAYLSSNLIKRVMDDEEVKKKFVKNYEPYQKQNIRLSDIYEHIEKIDKLIIKDLKEMVYHKLYTVKTLYKATLGIDLGNQNTIDTLMSCVSIRHDIVHRNGKDKNGNKREITKQMVLDLSETINNFILNIEKQFEGLE